MKTETETTTANLDYIKLVVRRMYDAQKLRIQSDLRLQRLVRDGLVLKEDAEKDFAQALKAEVQAENEYERIIWREIKNMPVIQDWLIKVKGIGPRLAGLLVANIAPISRFATISKLWAYAGLHVKDGKAAKRAKGEKANWNAELKTTAWKIGKSFIKAGGPYRELYDEYKQYLVLREIKKGNVIWKVPSPGAKPVAAHVPKGIDASPPKGAPEWTLGRIDAMATRKTVKLFLSHLWLVWREIEGLPVSDPFVIASGDHPTHTHLIGPWSMIEEPPCSPTEPS